MGLVYSWDICQLMYVTILESSASPYLLYMTSKKHIKVLLVTVKPDIM